MITVVGMGRGKDDLTAGGARAIVQADVVVVKSKLTHVAKTVATIRKDAVFCDDLYKQAENFDQLNNLIIDRLLSFSKQKVVFCVVGEGADDSTVQLMQDVAVIHGVPLYAGVVGNNLAGGTAVFTAQDVMGVARVLPVPTVVKCIDDKFVASDVQLKLSTAFDVDTPVVLSVGDKIIKTTLDNLCKQQYDYQTTLYVLPKNLADRQVFDYYDCADILAILRSPNGCPWDREQTHKSIIKNVIEEAYELADALEKEDTPHVVEELGDLLMQALFHLDIANADGEFEPSAVYTGLCRKLIDRHPHVFGNVQVADSSQSLDVWEKQKQQEHQIKGTAQNVLDVPRGMSAIMRSQKVQSRASKGGYDFSDVQQVVDKVNEELQEFLSANDENRNMEGGDLLFAVINLLRLCGVDSETALLLSTEKFVRRVVECERILASRGQQLKQLSLQQFDDVWAEAKHNVG